jgi:hypothetical protein
MTLRRKIKKTRVTKGCTKWIRISDEEEEYYPDENGRISNYKTCGTCKIGTSILHAIHVSPGTGDAICVRCNKDIDLIWLCRDRKSHM